jgi:type I restriction enzyme S subunit
MIAPMPSVAEQHRIVAKVDEFIKLCDQLEANIRTRNDTASRYAEAIVNGIAAA